MIRRWFIRIIFMLPVLLCVAGWEWSYFYIGGIGYTSRPHECFVRTWRGALYVSYDNKMVANGGEIFAHSLEPNERFWFDSIGPHLLGFSAGTVKYVGGGRMGYVGVPWWFLTTASALTMGFAWRKTGKSKAERAFPVEVAATEKQT